MQDHAQIQRRDGRASCARKVINYRAIVPYLGLVIVVVFFQAMTGRVFTASNLKAMLNDGFSITLGAVGYIFVIAQGNLDFSISGIMGLACAISAIVAKINPYIAVFAAILVGIVVGMINGFLVAHLHMDSFIATMALSYLLQGVIVNVLDGGIIAAPFQMLEWSTLTMKISVMLIVLIAGGCIFTFTPFGKRNRAVGTNETVAHQSGVNICSTKIMGFVIMGVMAALVGFFSLLRTGTASSNSAGNFLTNAFDAVLLGGVPIDGGSRTRFRSAVIGSLTMTALNNGMTLIGLGSLTMQLVTGLIFITVIAISFNRKNMTEIK